jgi:hypothetical protein
VTHGEPQRETPRRDEVSRDGATGGDATGHPTELLAAYAAGVAPAAGAVSAANPAGELTAHLASCATCAAEVESWRKVAGVVRERAARVPHPRPGIWVAIRERLGDTGIENGQTSIPTGIPTGIPAGIATGVPGGVPRYGAAMGGRPLERAIGLIAHQWRLIRWPVWAASASILATATVLAAMAPAGAAGRVLAAAVPLVAALAVGVACGSDADPGTELVRSAPTSPRAVLLARLTLVLGGVVAGGLVASAVLALGAGGGAADGVPGVSPPEETPGPYVSGELLEGMFALVATWFAPLVPLTAVSFALSVFLRPSAGVGAAMGLWVVHALSSAPGVGPLLGRLVEPVWSPDAAVFVAAVALLAATLIAAPRLPLRPPWTG